MSVDRGKADSPKYRAPSAAVPLVARLRERTRTASTGACCQKWAERPYFDLSRTGVGERAMESESRHTHWQDVYTRKGENEVSWFQEDPAPSLELIAQVGATPSSAIIDIGAGASRLVDRLI